MRVADRVVRGNHVVVDGCCRRSRHVCAVAAPVDSTSTRCENIRSRNLSCEEGMGTRSRDLRGDSKSVVVSDRSPETLASRMERCSGAVLVRTGAQDLTGDRYCSLTRPRLQNRAPWGAGGTHRGRAELRAERHRCPRSSGSSLSQTRQNLDLAALYTTARLPDDGSVHCFWTSQIGWICP